MNASKNGKRDTFLFPSINSKTEKLQNFSMFWSISPLQCFLQNIHKNNGNKVEENNLKTHITRFPKKENILKCYPGASINSGQHQGEKVQDGHHTWFGKSLWHGEPCLPFQIHGEIWFLKERDNLDESMHKKTMNCIIGKWQIHKLFCSYQGPKTEMRSPPIFVP